MKLWLPLTLGISLWAGAAFGQACCTATGSSEFGVVGRCQNAVLATQVGFEHATGSYDRDGQYRPLGRGQVQDTIFTIGGGVRILDPKFQVSTSIPFRSQQRDFGTASSSQSMGIGDVGLALRYTLLEDSMRGWKHGGTPFLDLIAVSRLPTGRAPDQGAPKALGADVMGEGLLAMGGGLRVVTFMTSRHALFASGIYEVRTNTSSTERPTGDALTGAFGSLHLLTLKWSMSVFGSVRHVFDDANDNVPKASGLTRLRPGVSVNYAFVVPTWEVSTGITFDPPWSAVSRNVPFAGVNPTVSLKRNFP